MPYVRSPTIKVHDLSRFHMRFQLADTDVSVANALRRTMIAEVPTMAINLVTVKENTSPLADEYIVHRLGLIPLHSENIIDFNYAHDCECDDYCQHCSVKYELNVSAAGEQMRKVTSRDLKITSPMEHAKCQRVRPVHDSGDVEPKPMELVDSNRSRRLAAGRGPGGGSSGATGNGAGGDNDDENDTGDAEGIIIARLSRGQRIHMEGIARKGIAKDHAKHSPMCTVAYRIVPPAVELLLERLNGLLSAAARKELADSAVGVIYIDDGTGELKYTRPYEMGRITVNPDTTRKAGMLAVAAGGKADEVVRLNPEPKCFEFTAETTGAMSPAQALDMALDVLTDKVDTVLSNLR